MLWHKRTRETTLSLLKLNLNTKTAMFCYVRSTTTCMSVELSVIIALNIHVIALISLPLI